ncbi:MAG: leucine-rich repeat domain-containing protein [Magnetococcales bacterium]|nr:leucine-rich repeat domain-containing protein [Magnetococcales bacterium]
MDRDTLLHILDEAYQEQVDLLDLSGLDLQELPAEIGRFVHIRRLFLADNRLTTLPPEIAQLTSLELLDLRRNRIRHLPAQMATLSSLSYVWLGGNDLTALPPVITALTSLQRLVLRHNRLTTLPPEVGALTRLRELSLQDNRLTFLPEEIGLLKALELLFLADNALTSLPVSLRELTALQRLDLSGNQLRDLPVGMHRLTSLVQLDLRKNPLSAIPEALQAKPEDVEAIRSLSRQRDATNRIPLREGRLVVLGPPGVGKSALIRRLREEPFASVEAPSGVLTIRVWHLPDTLTQSDKVGSSIRLNVWELAGSEAARGVYPWLLAPGTMILLVVEDRGGEAARQIDRWLALATRPGVEIPVIVACTRSDQTLMEPEWEFWQQRHPCIREVVPQISARTGEGMAALRQAVLRTALTLESVRALVPETWQRVRQSIEAEDTPAWTRESLYATYIEAGITESHAQEDLTEILCRLGLLLSGRRENYGSPEWGGRLLSRLLDAPAVVRQGGVLGASALLQLADGIDKPRLLAFLEGWACAMPLANGDLLVPALLPRETPVEARWEEIPPVCEYHYPEGVPPGLLARIIARVREQVIPGLWWRKGVVLQDANATAQARMALVAEGPRLSLGLRGEGEACRALLVQCHGVVQEIHQDFPALPVHIRLPVPGVPTVSLALEHVRCLAEQGVATCIPEGCVSPVVLGPLSTLAGWLEGGEDTA